MPLAAKFQDNLMLKPKRPIFKNYAKTQKNNTQSPKSSIVAIEHTRDAAIFMMFSSWNVEMQAWSIGALKVM